MSIKTISLNSRSELPEGFENLVSGSNSPLFLVSEQEKKRVAILSSSRMDEMDLKGVLTGKSKEEILVIVDRSAVSNERTRNVYMRSLLARIKKHKGLSIYKRTIYILPAGSTNSIYDDIPEIKIEKNKLQKLINSGVNTVVGSNEEELDDGEIIRQFSLICENAFKENASDIHFALDENEKICSIQYRINSELEHIEPVSYNLGLAMCRAAYSSKADSSSRSDTSFNEKLRQDARIELSFNGSRVAFRYAATPTSTGSLVVLRLLPIGVDTNIKTLTELGYLKSQARMIESMMRKPIGALVVSGVTGSGKSTTLKTLLDKKIDENPTKRVITIEQPVEYKIRGAMQIPAANGINSDENPFIGAIKTSMRLDPDTIMIGEVRDKTTADLLASATESGHSVLTTVHASSALEIITRLTGKAMQLPIDTVASISFISGLIYQKLSPILCDNCKKPLDVMDFSNSEDEYKQGLINRLQMVTDLSVNTIYTRNEEGCECCRKGVTGVEVCAETILPDLKLRALWKEGDDVGAYHHWRATRNPQDPENGQGKTALDIAIYKMNQGRMCPVGIEKIFGDINEDAVQEDGTRSYKEI